MCVCFVVQGLRVLLVRGGGVEDGHSTQRPPVDRGLKDQQPDIVEVHEQSCA